MSRLCDKGSRELPPLERVAGGDGGADLCSDFAEFGTDAASDRLSTLLVRDVEGMAGAAASLGSTPDWLSTLLVRDGGRAGTVTSPSSTSVDESWLVCALRTLFCEGVVSRGVCVGVCLFDCVPLLCDGVPSRGVCAGVTLLCCVELLCEGVDSRDVCTDPDSDLREALLRALFFPSALPGVFPARGRADGGPVSFPVEFWDMYSSRSENVDAVSSDECREYVDASSLSPEYAEPLS